MYVSEICMSVHMCVPHTSDNSLCVVIYLLVPFERHPVGGGGQRLLRRAPLQRERDAVRQLHVEIEGRLPFRLVLHVLTHLEVYSNEVLSKMPYPSKGGEGVFRKESPETSIGFSVLWVSSDPHIKRPLAHNATEVNIPTEIWYLRNRYSSWIAITTTEAFGRPDNTVTGVGN